MKDSLNAKSFLHENSIYPFYQPKSMESFYLHYVTLVPKLSNKPPVIITRTKEHVWVRG